MAVYKPSEKSLPATEGAIRVILDFLDLQNCEKLISFNYIFCGIILTLAEYNRWHFIHHLIISDYS